ncbi:efflux RND transporter periplasmic adaptor subunit [Maridesulfovibrio sp.]|uniref:efflux RND transporter periplasmic adaptor subunit n=1 Tax=Maridesulfovibrio sp. TaxID=2795000 RepID=UPI0029C9F827|nr:efflux RND transporter periplasmic adaptor subunit [Maridesulfovibrio sp.]
MTKKCIFVAMLGAAIMFLVLWMSGSFKSGVIEPGRIVSIRNGETPTRTALAEVVSVPVIYEAVGTVRPETEASIEAQVTGKVRKVLVRSGQKVSRGDTLIVLDHRQLQARLESAQQGLKSAQAAERQAREGINAAKAESNTATATWKRMKKLFEGKVATQDELDRVEAAYLKAKAALAQAEDGLDAATARVRQARKGVEESRIGLGYTTIKAPADGEVARRMVEPGDLAFPGKTLMLIQTGGTLRLEALVREGLIGQVRIGQKLDVDIEALGDLSEAIVEEVVPSADPLTRTFLVKAGLKPLPGLYPGMFGRLLIPVGQKDVVLVPAKAVSRVGQLETVLVQSGESWEPFYVRSGAKHGNKLEILSGLNGNETVGYDLSVAGGQQ